MSDFIMQMRPWFGDEEKNGGGLCDEILNGIASGVPFLVAVPETNLDEWTKRTGGTGTVLTFDESALQSWWMDAV